MTQQEFHERDCQLLSQINNYKMDSADKQAQIAINEREIARLQNERILLRYQLSAGAPNWVG